MRIIFGTKNNAKVDSMQKSLNGLKPEFDIELVGLNQLNYVFPEVSENGNTPLDNARIKATTYFDIIKEPVFSLDSGLYFENLPNHLQPGLNIRRINGKRLNDDEMIEYYSQLAQNNGGKIVARYINGICLVMGNNLIFEHMGEDISTAKFILTSIPHSKRVDGFPLDSLSIHIESNKYYYDIENKRYDKENFFSTDKGFCEFFKSAILDSKMKGVFL